MRTDIPEIGYPYRGSRCWSLLGMGDGGIFKAFHDVTESVKRAMKDIKIIVARLGKTTRGFLSR